MGKVSKRYQEDLKKVPSEPVALGEAINVIKSFADTKFDQTVEISMWLGIDPKHADQALRGAVSLPHGIGKAKRVIAFVPADKVEAAKAAGAIEAGAEELVKKIEDGWFDFDVAIAEPSMMRVVARLGRTLGPKGLMPTPKGGTVTPAFEQAIKEFAAGKVEYRNDDGGNLAASVGKKSFDATTLTENAQAFIDHIVKVKPSGAKGQYIKKVAISGTMTPSVTVEL